MNSAATPGIDAGRRRRQLPAELSGFVGRTDELAALVGLLRRGRLVTVTGPGGVGKTRLALRAAADAANRYADGTRLVELSGLADPALLPAAAAECLGLHGRDPRPSRAAVLDHLRGRRLLLIFDGCEHLTTAVARFTSQLLRETNGITILATSRQPLHLAGEQVLRLGPLPVPEAGRDPAPGGAVELFATRAAAAAGGFTVSEAELPDVIRICRRLDGLPLGLELAAVRVRALPLAELADRLDASFSVLAGARRGAAPRQQTLRAAIDWSFDLCTEAERAVWARLSVFAGSFDLAAARDVAACPLVPAGRVGDVLAGLVDKSVVLRGDGLADPPGGRYRLTGPAREYGAERLAAADQEGEARRRHARWYRRIARSFLRHLLADDQATRLRELQAEHADLSAALAHGFAAAGPRGRRDAARLATALLPYWLMSGRLREGIGWQDAVLGSAAADSGEAAGALASRAVLGAMLGAPEAVTDARAAIAVAARSGDGRGDGDGRAGGLGYLALQLALGLGLGPGLAGYRESVEAAAQARLRLTGADLDAARRCLDVQLGLASALGGSCTAAVAAGRRALAGLGPGERWLHGYVAITSALALYRQPGRRPECAGAAGEATERPAGSRGPGRRGLRARPDGLAGGRRRPVRALCLAARGGPGALAAGRRQARRQPGHGGTPGAGGRGRRPCARPRAVRGAARAGGGRADRADRRARGGGR